MCLSFDCICLLEETRKRLKIVTESTDSKRMSKKNKRKQQTMTSKQLLIFHIYIYTFEHCFLWNSLYHIHFVLTAVACCIVDLSMCWRGRFGQTLCCCCCYWCWCCTNRKSNHKYIGINWPPQRSLLVTFRSFVIIWLWAHASVIWQLSIVAVCCRLSSNPTYLKLHKNGNLQQQQ